MRSTFPPALAAFALVAGVARAEQIDVKPGLWETSMVMRREGATPSLPPMPDLSQLTPEQRAQVEKMMALHRGDEKPMVERSCITAAQLAKWDEFWKDESDSDCARKMLESSSRHAKMSMTCHGGEMTGTMDLKAESRERMTGAMRMVHRVPEGERTTQAEMTSRWLGADCGDVKPEPE